MLLELDIRNFAVIKKVNITFSDKMTVLLGETGAGKSILIDALAVLTGHRAQKEMIRTGEDKASVTGLFSLDSKNVAEINAILSESGIESEQELLVQRELSITGRNVVRVNGQLSTMATIKRLGRLLVDIHGQNDQQVLLDSKRHIALLDHFIGQSFEKELAEYQTAYQAYRQSQKKLNELENHTQEVSQRLDILNFQKKELDGAQIENDHEDDELEETFNRLSNYQKIVDATAQLDQLLNNEDQGLNVSLAQAKDVTDDLADYGEDYQQLAETMSDAYYSLSDANSQLSNLISNLDFDEQQFNEVNERLNLLNNLKQKYGPTLSDVMAFHAKVDQELNEFDAGGFDLEKVKQTTVKLQETARQLAEQIHGTRQQATLRLKKAIQQQLKDLYMEKATFSVHLTKTDELNSFGIDQVEFYISPNPGETEKPLTKIASGGEQSRIMLALKTILNRHDGVQTMIFDEIDTGVSGRVAAAIGQKMKEIASGKQVIAITHSPQVAAIAQQRKQITKTVENGVTTTKVTDLNFEASITAIAKMLAGSKVTPAATNNAKELLRKNDA